MTNNGDNENNETLTSIITKQPQHKAEVIFLARNGNRRSAIPPSLKTLHRSLFPAAPSLVSIPNIHIANKTPPM